MRPVTVLFFLIAFSFSALLAQEEKVHAFHAEIRVDSSGVTAVHEHIRIFANGDLFKRGITRALPLSRRDKDGNRIKIDYRIAEVRQDGLTAAFFTESDNDELVIYVGEKERFLEPGFYTYEIMYESTGQVGFFADYDELSWNVNGKSDQTIDSVSAVLQLPASAEIVSSRCYTGVYGSTGSNCHSEIMEDGSFMIAAANLPPEEMLTLSVGFSKGVVRQPPPVEPRIFTYFDRNGLAYVSFIVVALLFLYFLFTWRKYGIDPPKPVVIPQFSPPDALSPASVGMLYKDRFVEDLITPSVVDLSVKGYIHIEEIIERGLFGMRRDRRYLLTKLKENDHSLPEEEQIVMKHLFATSNQFQLDGKYNEKIADMANAFKASMEYQLKSVLKEGKNRKFHVIPWLGIIVYIFIFFIFAADELMGFPANRIAAIITFPLLVVGYLVYARLIVRPGERKLHYRSSIEGLKMYLDFAEEKRLQYFNPPSVTPAVFEQLLPYAIALDMEKVWGEKFENTFLSSAMEPDAYRPAWYGGTYLNPARFGHVFNSTFSNTMSHAATPPQSSSSGGGGNWSSGSFGGGFSGMGGGGGKVGGW